MKPPLIFLIFNNGWENETDKPTLMAARRGQWYPTVITLGIAAILSDRALYAWSGAGLIPRLPFLHLGLCAITGVYLLRTLLRAAPNLLSRQQCCPLVLEFGHLCLDLGLLHALGLGRAILTSSDVSEVSVEGQSWGSVPGIYMGAA